MCLQSILGVQTIGEFHWGKNPYKSFVTPRVCERFLGEFFYDSDGCVCVFFFDMFGKSRNP